MDSPEFIAPQRFDDADAAVAQVRRIHDAGTAFLRYEIRRGTRLLDALGLDDAAGAR